MNSILEKNRNSLREIDSDIKEYLETNRQEQKEQSEEMLPALEVGTEEIEGRKVLYVIKDEKQYQLDSLYDNTELLDRWFNQIDNKTYRSRYLLFGLGNGMYVRKLLKEAGEEAAIIVVEPSKEIFAKVMEEFDISDILANKRVVLIVNEVSDKNFIDFLREILQYEDMTGAVCRSYLNYPVLFKEEYEKFHEVIQHHSNTVEANNTVLKRMGEAYFYGSMYNYIYYVKGKSLIALNKKLPKDIPAILVSAGPSLDKNMKYLREAKGKAFLLAVDSAASALVKNGIIPDMVISIDATKNMRHFTDETVQQIPLITNMFASWKMMALHTGDKYFLHDGNTYVEKFFEKIGKMLPRVAGGGSVATDGFALLERLKFKTIILVGQDLAYTNKKTHSKDTIRGKQNEDINNFNLISVEDINGDIIPSSYEFQVYLDWFNEEIASHSEFEVIDATEGGAKITGTKIMTLRDAIQQFCEKEVDVSDILKDIPDRLTEDEQKEFLEYIRNIPSRMQQQLLLVQENIKQYKQIKSCLKKAEIDLFKIKKLQRKIEKNNEELEKDSIYFYTMFITAEKLQESFPNGVLEIQENAEDEKNKVIEDSIRYFEVIQECLQDYIPRAEKIIRIQDEMDCKEWRRQHYLDMLAEGGNNK